VISLLLLLAGPALASPSPVQGLVSVTPFHLDAPLSYRWCAERPDIDEGLILVLRVDPAVARPLQGPEAELYVGDRPAQRLSWSATASALVVLVPGPVDLARVPVYWGPQTLPEQVDLAAGTAALASARAAGIQPFGAAQIAAVQQPPLDLADPVALMAAVQPLVQQWAPLPMP